MRRTPAARSPAPSRSGVNAMTTEPKPGGPFHRSLRGAAALVVLHRPGDLRPGRGDRLYRLVGRRHDRQLGQAARAGEPVARHLSAHPRARLRRRRRPHRPDAARLPRRQHHRPHAAEDRRGDGRPHAGGARPLQELQADLRDRVQPERRPVPPGRTGRIPDEGLRGRSSSSPPSPPARSPTRCRSSR